MTPNKKKNIIKASILASLLAITFVFVNAGEKDSSFSQLLKENPKLQHYFKVETKCGEQLVPIDNGEVRSIFVSPDGQNLVQGNDGTDCYYSTACHCFKCMDYLTEER